MGNLTAERKKLIISHLIIIEKLKKSRPLTAFLRLFKGDGAKINLKIVKNTFD